MTNVTFLPWVDPHEELSSDPLVTASGSDEPEVMLDGPSSLSHALFGQSLDQSLSQETDSGVDVGSDSTEPDSQQCENALLRKLNHRDMSIAEVRSWLSDQNVPEVDAEEIIVKFERLDYLDDTRLAESVATHMSHRQGKSKSVISRLLQQRGISSFVIASALEQLSEDDELNRAIEIASRRARQMTSLDPQVAERRLIGFLSRRGYSGNTLRQAVRVALES